MGSFKMLMFIATAAIMTFAQKPATASATDDAVVMATRDYVTLQGILGKNLPGTATEKAKIVDLLLQLLEEIDFTTLCEVIANDTKWRSNVFSQVPIKSTKIDIKLLNELRSQMTNELKENTEMPKSFNNAAHFGQETRHADIELSRDDVVKKSTANMEDFMESKVIPATYKYHRNELRNSDLENTKDPNINTGALDFSRDAKLTKSRDIGAKYRNQHIERNYETQSDFGLPLFSSLPRMSGNSNNNINSVQSKNELKHLAKSNKTNTVTINSYGAQDINVINKIGNYKRPRAQLFAKPLVVGDWLKEKRLSNQNKETNSVGNRNIFNTEDVTTNLENYIEVDNGWLDFNKRENQKRINSKKLNKKSNPFLENEGIGRKTIEHKQKSDLSRTTTKIGNNLKDSDLNIAHNQHEVDYLEELRSNFRHKQMENQLTHHNNARNQKSVPAQLYLEDEETIADKYNLDKNDVLIKENSNKPKVQTAPFKHAIVDKNVTSDGLDKYSNMGISQIKMNRNDDNSEIASDSQSLQSARTPDRFLDTKNRKLYNTPPTKSHFPTSTTQSQTDPQSLSVPHNITATSAQKSAKSSRDMDKNKSTKFNSNTDLATTATPAEFLTTATPGEFLTTALASNSKSTNLVLFNSSRSSSSQQNVSTINSPQEHAKLAEKQQNKTTIKNMIFRSIFTSSKPEDTNSINILKYGSILVNNNMLSNTEASSVTTEALPTDSDRLVYSSTVLRHIEAKMKDGIPSVESVLKAEYIPNLKSVGANTRVKNSTEGDFNVLQLDLANINQINDIKNDVSPDKNTSHAILNTRMHSKTSLPSSKATNDVVAEPQSNFTAVDNFLNDRNINYRTEVDNFDASSLVDQERDLSENDNQINITITNGEQAIRGTSKKMESSFSLVSTNENKPQAQTDAGGNEMQASLVTLNILSGDHDTLTINGTGDMVNSSQSSHLPLLHSVVMTTAKNGDANKMTTGTEKTDLNETINDVLSSSTTSRKLQNNTSHYYTSTYQPTLKTNVQNTSEKQGNKPVTIMREISMNAEMHPQNISNNSHPSSLSSQDPALKKRSHSHGLGTPGTNTTTGIPSPSTFNKLSNQTASLTTTSHEIQNDDNTTSKTTSHGTTTLNNVNNFHKVTFHQAADVDKLIQPAFIDYGDKRLYITQTSSVTNSEQNSTEVIESTPTYLNPKFNVEATASQNKITRSKSSGNYHIVDNIAPSSSVVEQTTNENKNAKDLVKITQSRPIISENQTKTAELQRHPSHQNITTDRLKMVASKVAETKANLSEINIHLLKQSALKVQKHIVPINDNFSIYSVDVKKNTEGIQLPPNAPEARKQNSTMEASFDKPEVGTLSNSEAYTTENLYTTSHTEPKTKFETEFLNIVSKTSAASDDNKEINSNTGSSTNDNKKIKPNTSSSTNDSKEINSNTIFSIDDNKEINPNTSFSIDDNKEINPNTIFSIDDNKEINSNTNFSTIDNKEINSNTNFSTNDNKEINSNTNFSTIDNKEINSNTNFSTNDNKEINSNTSFSINDNKEINSNTNFSTNDNKEINSNTNFSTNDNKEINSNTNFSTNDNKEINSNTNFSINDNKEINPNTRFSIYDNKEINSNTSFSIKDNKEINTNTNSSTNDNKEINPNTNFSTNDNKEINPNTNSSTNDNKEINPNTRFSIDDNKEINSNTSFSINDNKEINSNTNFSIDDNKEINSNTNFSIDDNKEINSNTSSSTNTENVKTPSTFSSDYTSTLTTLTDVSTGLQMNHANDPMRITAAINVVDSQSTAFIKLDKTNNFAETTPSTILPSNNIRHQSDYLNNRSDFPNLKLKSNYQKKSISRPSISQYSNSVYRPNIKNNPTPLLDSWKTYNIAVSKLKTRQISQEINEHTNVPEILLYSDYKNKPQKEGNSMNYLWRARPWVENTRPQNNRHNSVLTHKSGFYSNKNTDNINPIRYQTKTLNSIGNFPNIVKEINNVGKWKNRFSQGYYGRVFEGRGGLNMNTQIDSTNHLPFYSQETINFDRQNKHDQEMKKIALFEAERNKHQIWNQGLGLKPVDTKDTSRNHGNKNNSHNFPPNSKPEIRQENRKSPKYSFRKNNRKISEIVNDNSVNRKPKDGKDETSEVMKINDVIQWKVDPQATPNDIQTHYYYKCPGLFGYHRDPQDCQAFFICSWGMAHRVVCPHGTLYNSKEMVCDWAVNVSCVDNQNSMSVGL